MTDPSAPLPDYDELTLGTLQHRIRALDREQLASLIDYERAHANRVHVLEVLTARQDELDAGAEPSPGEQPGTPETAEPTRHGTGAGPETQAEPRTPQRHGEPGLTPKRGRP